MTQVELIYEKTCPNIQAARDQLAKAFNEAGVTPQWREWESNDPATPDYARHFGSPTILVEGRDVSGVRATDSAVCCRIYQNADSGNRGVPALADIVNALRQTQK